MLTPPSLHRSAQPSHNEDGVELVSGWSALQARRAAWMELWRTLPRATPFESPAWLLPWAHHFAPDRTHALLVRRGDRYLGVLPFFTWQEKLLLAGTGPSDYGDALIANDQPAIAEALLARLCRIASQLQCRCVDLQQLRPGSALLDAPAPHGWSDEIQAGIACPVTTLIGSEGIDLVSPHWRKNSRRAQRLLSRDFDVALALVEPADAERCVDTLERLHGLRWAARDASHAFSDPMTRGFIREVVPELARAGLLRLQQLLIAGEPAAVVFAIGGAQAHYYYMSGFDPRWSRYSTGLITVLEAMRQAARERAGEFHFLRGGEAYKYHLGSVDRPTLRRVLRPLDGRH